MSIKSFAAYIVLLLSISGSFNLQAQSPQYELSERIRHRMEVLDGPGELVAGGELLYAAAVIRQFYEKRGYQPLWLADGHISDSLQSLPDGIRSALGEGLTPSHYHLAVLTDLLERVMLSEPAQRDPRNLADIELLASDALLTLAKHYADGKVAPETIDADWFLARPDSTLLPLLEDVASNTISTEDALSSLLPLQPAYSALRERLALQRELNDEGEWEPIPEGPTLKFGDEGPRVAAVRDRLVQLSDMVDIERYAEIFDEAMVEPVRRFQMRHGLEPDGVVGKRTLSALNTSPGQRIAQIRANMERWRWLPELGSEYIVVNIAGFHMDVISDGKQVMRQRVIVGRPYRRTPVFTDKMTYLVLNPSWEVPHKLAAQDQLPQIAKDPDYLERMGFVVLQGWGSDERVVAPDSVDWASLSPRRFPYRLRQRPGPQNALGQVKFMFPNRHNVYLHDTPARGLFAKEDRAFSSGCIRLQDPLALAEWLLGGEGRPPVMTGAKMHAVLDKGKEATVKLGRPVPVHLLYWTAWVEESQVHYRPDIYERDDSLLQALNEIPPKVGN